MTPPVYVALVNYNGSKDTIECLESLLRSDYPEIRVFVVDNGSADDSIAQLIAWAGGTTPPGPPKSDAMAALSTPPVPKPVALRRAKRSEIESATPVDWSTTRVCVVETGANLGFAGANNIAFAYVTRHDPDALLMLLNNDTVIAPDAITRMVARASTPGVAAVGCTILQYRAPDRVETYGGATVRAWNGFSELIGADAPRSAPRHARPMDFLSGCCMLVTREGLKRVGGLDDRFFLYSEDTDWGMRATDAGLTLLSCDDAEIWHKGGGTAVHRSAFHERQVARSVLLLVAKHRPLALPAASVHLAIRLMGPKLVRGDWTRLNAVWQGCLDFIRAR